MLQSINLKDAPELRKLIQAGFPGYRKTSCFISEFPDAGTDINSYWDGGSRDEYAIVELATMQRKPLPTRTHPYFEIAVRGLTNHENSLVSIDHVGNVTLKVLPEGFALISAGTFCGKPSTAHIYFNPANLTKMLPAPVEPIAEVRVSQTDTNTQAVQS